MAISAELRKFIDSVPDFRRTDKGNVKHKLSDMLLLVIIGNLTGCTTRQDMIDFGEKHHVKLKRLGLFENGIPSQSSFCRLEKRLDDDAMAERMADFARHFRVKFRGKDLELIAIDGKCTRGTIQKNGRCPDIVSAYSESTGMTLDTEMCEEKSNEIKAAPKIIERLDISNSVITLDAMYCQKDVLDTIRRRNGHFLVEVKANQKQLRWGLEDRLDKAAFIDTHTQEPTLAHGRIEGRTCRTYSGKDVGIDCDKWGKDLTVIEIMTKTITKSTRAETAERRIYITDLKLGAKELSDMSRRHWSIESMHWLLDYDMRQDATKRKYPRSARNMDTLQRLSLSLMSIWRNNRKKREHKNMGCKEIVRNLSLNSLILRSY